MSADIVERLRQAGSVGLDLSPGDPLCAEAAAEITRLREQRDAAIEVLGTMREFIRGGSEVLARIRGETKP